MTPEHERVFGVQRAIWHFKRARFSPCGLWPSGLQMMIRHTLFDLFAKGRVRIQTLIIRTYILESFDHYK